MTQKVCSQHASTLFGVVFLVLNISNADCLLEIHSVVGKERLFVTGSSGLQWAK